MDLAAAAQEQRHVLGTRMTDMGSAQEQGGMGELGAALPPKDCTVQEPWAGTAPGMVVLGDRVVVVELPR